jgi:hypothetical protein
MLRRQRSTNSWIEESASRMREVSMHGSVSTSSRK